MGAGRRQILHPAVPPHHRAARTDGGHPGGLARAVPERALLPGEHRGTASGPALAAVRRPGGRLRGKVAAGPDGGGPGQERHPRRRRRAAHRQRLRLLLLPQLGHVADDGQTADGGACPGPRQGAHGHRRLARVLPPALQAGHQGLAGKAAGPAHRRGTAGGRAGAAGRRYRLLHGRAVHHSAGHQQRAGLPHLLRQAGPSRRGPASPDVPPGVRQRTHPGGEVALGPGRLGPQ